MPRRMRLCSGVRAPEGFVWRNLVPDEYGIPYRSLINYEKKEHHFPGKGLYIPKLKKYKSPDSDRLIFYQRNDVKHISYVRGLLGQKDCRNIQNN